MSDQQKTYKRFDVARRIEHFVLILSFSTLGLTGLIQKYPFNPVSEFLVAALGGIITVRIIHRIAATIFAIEGIYHGVIAVYVLFVQRKRATMIPGIKDGVDAYQFLLHNIGIGKKPPKMPRYNFAEKLEYWAMIWGYFLMGLTGLMLWNPIATTKLLPGVFIPAAKAAHGAEAVLAVLAILLWHFYNVHIKQWNWSMIKGKLTRHEMVEEHAEELELIESGKQLDPVVPPEEYKKRLVKFMPVSIVLSIVLIAGLIYFITFEETAITTVAPVYAEGDVYVPQTPTPLPTQAPTPTPDLATMNTWDGGIGALFEQKCSLCHGTNGGFSVESYASVLQGGDNGLVIDPGDPDNSKLVELVAPGNNHPGQFTQEELDRVILWIKNGANK